MMPMTRLRRNRPPGAADRRRRDLLTRARRPVPRPDRAARPLGQRRAPQRLPHRLRRTRPARSRPGRRAPRRRAQERPLLGVPIAVKDDIDVAGEVTTYGTNAYGAPAAADAEVVRRLREAGAVIIGKTNVPELTQWPFTETATFGATRNPWNLQHAPGGSSGGSAAAVAAGLVGAALGSDGAGSIRIPAAWCGLFGLKPQRGRVSMAPALARLARPVGQGPARAHGRRHRAVPRRRLRRDRGRRRPRAGARGPVLDRGRHIPRPAAHRLLDERAHRRDREARPGRAHGVRADDRAAALARAQAHRARPRLRRRRDPRRARALSARDPRQRRRDGASRAPGTAHAARCRASAG